MRILKNPQNDILKMFDENLTFYKEPPERYSKNFDGNFKDKISSIRKCFITLKMKFFFCISFLKLIRLIHFVRKSVLCINYQDSSSALCVPLLNIANLDEFLKV